MKDPQHGWVPQKMWTHMPMASAMVFLLFLGLGPAAAQTSPSAQEMLHRIDGTSDNEEAIESALQLQEMAERSGDRPDLLAAYVRLARSYLKASNVEEANRYADLGLALLAEAATAPEVELSLRRAKGEALSRMGSTEGALEQGLRAYALAREIGTPRPLLETTQLLATLYGRLGKHAESLRYHLESLETFGLQDTLPRLQVLNNVIVVLVRMGDLDRAAAYSDQAEELRRTFGGTTPEVRVVSANLLVNRANILRLQGKHLEQLAALQEADALTRSASDARTVALVTGALADAYINLGDYPKAIAYSRRALRTTDSVQSPYPHAIAMANLGLALSKSGNHDKGLENLLGARDLLEKVQARAEALEVQGLVADAYRAAGNFPAAASEYKRLKDATERFRREQAQSRLTETRAEFEAKLARKEVALLEAERQVQVLAMSRQRLLATIAGAALVGALIILGLGWARYRLKVRAYDELARANADLDRALEEIKTLQGMLPICAQCKSIRDEEGLWSRIETYISRHSDTQFSHTLCPDCLRELYPDFADR